MSSRSIGVTKVWLRRWMMSCVIRSPSCWGMRISRASSVRSGYWVRSCSSRAAARRMFPPASSNRSKNSRSRGARTLARRTRRKLALRDVEPGELHAPGRQLAHALAHRRDRGLPVVLGSPALDAVALDEGVGGAVVAVPGHSDAAGIEQLDAARSRAPELHVRVAEHHALRLHALEQLAVEWSRLSAEALHVRARRRVAEQRVADLGRPRQLHELRHKLVAEELGRPRRDLLHRLRCVVAVGQP